MDAPTQTLGAKAERGQPSEHRTEPSREKGSRPDEKMQSSAEKTRSLGERLRAHWLLLSIAAGLVLMVLVGGAVYWLSVRDYESTDDAFIAARDFSVASKVAGYVTAVPVTDNQHVKAGELLAQIDDRDYKIAVSQAQAQVAVAQANIQNVQAQIDSQHQQIDQAQAQVNQARAQSVFAQQEEGRAKDLLQKGAGTLQAEQQARSNQQAQEANTARTRAALIAARLGIKTLQAQLESAKAQLQQAQAQFDQAKLNLQYTKVLAAQDGRVVQLSGAVGTYVTPGQSLMMFVPDRVWIVANFKETQLKDMRPGQSVEIRIDAYPDRKLTGHVASVQPGSGTAFSLLPAENATGNYVKVVQRVPVKIVVDKWPPDLPIGPGMSVVPWVKVR